MLCPRHYSNFWRYITELKTSDKNLYPHRAYLLVEYTTNNANRKKKICQIILSLAPALYL